MAGRLFRNAGHRAAHGCPAAGHAAACSGRAASRTAPDPSGAVMRPEDRLRRWAGWIIVAVGLDLAARAGLRRVPALAGNPGSASALALCWVHAFVLPPLFGQPWRGLSRLVATAGVGTLAAPFAVLVRFLLGLQTGLMAFLIGVAFSGPYKAGAVYDPPGPLLQAVQDVLRHVMVWSGCAAGTVCRRGHGRGPGCPDARRAASSPVLAGCPGRGLRVDRVPAGPGCRRASASLA